MIYRHIGATSEYMGDEVAGLGDLDGEVARGIGDDTDLIHGVGRLSGRLALG